MLSKNLRAEKKGQEKMIKRIKQAIQRFIIKTIVENYRNNGEVRQLITDGNVFVSERDSRQDVNLLFHVRTGEAQH